MDEVTILITHKCVIVVQFFKLNISGYFVVFSIWEGSSKMEVP